MSAPSHLRKLLLGCTRLGVILNATAVLLSSLSTVWWIGDLLANLRLQWLMAAVTLAIVLTILKETRWAIAACVLVGVLIPPIWLGLTMVAKDVPENEANTTPLTVAVFNVLSTNTQHDAIVRQIQRADADIVVIVELSTPLTKRIRRELLTEYPHFIEYPQDRGNFGIGLYSRLPMEDGRIFRLAATQTASIEASIRRAEGSYRLYATHPVPPLPASGFENRNQHLQELAGRIQEYHAQYPGAAVIVMGDLNVTPWSPVFREFCQSAGLSRCSGSVQPTWYARPVFPCGLVLDHILVSRGIGCSDFEVFEAAGSDHRLLRVLVRAADGAAASPVPE